VDTSVYYPELHEERPLDPESAQAAPAENAGGLELSIVMPCLNEAETLEVCIRKAQGFLKEHNVQGEVLIADNGSTDGSDEIARRMGARLVPVAEKGTAAP